MTKLSPTQAGVTSLFVYIVGQAVAFVPSLSNDQQQLISIGTLVIAAVFMLVHAAHAAIGLVQQFIDGRQKVTLAELEDGVRRITQDELGKVDLASLATSAMAGQLPTLVEQEVSRLRGELENELAGRVVAALKPPAPIAAVPDPPPPAA